jgi:GTPase SAR1 family protein
MRDRQGFILVYDITNPSSVDDLHDLYTQILRNKLPSSVSSIIDPEDPDPDPDTPIIPLVLVGNKLDLAIERKVSHQRGKELSRQWHCPHYETSAKTRTNVDEIFYDLVGQIITLKEEAVRMRKASATSLGSAGNHHNGEKEDDYAPTECCVIT